MVLSAQDDLDTVRQAADQGDAEAQYNLGVIYNNGEGVPKDDAEAVRWFQLAAEQGYAKAQFELGYKYRWGHGVPLDDAEAGRAGPRQSANRDGSIVFAGRCGSRAVGPAGCRAG